MLLIRRSHLENHHPSVVVTGTCLSSNPSPATCFVCLWANHFTSLCLSFVICNMRILGLRIIINSNGREVWEGGDMGVPMADSYQNSYQNSVKQLSFN